MHDIRLVYLLRIQKLQKNAKKRPKNVGLKSSYTAFNSLWLNALHAKMYDVGEIHFQKNISDMYLLHEALREKYFINVLFIRQK